MLRRGASRPVFAAPVSRAIDLRLRHFQKTGDASGCRETVEMWERLGRTDAQSLYDAACYWAVTAAVERAAEGADRGAAEADLAMDRFKKALDAGYTDFAHIEKDSDLDVLRDREDFKALLASRKALR